VYKVPQPTQKFQKTFYFLGWADFLRNFIAKRHFLRNFVSRWRSVQTSTTYTKFLKKFIFFKMVDFLRAKIVRTAVFYIFTSFFLSHSLILAAKMCYYLCKVCGIQSPFGGCSCIVDGRSYPPIVIQCFCTKCFPRIVEK